MEEAVSNIGKAAQDGAKGFLSGELAYKIGPVGGELKFLITTNNIEVADKLLKLGGKAVLGVGVVTLGALLGYTLLKPCIVDVVRRVYRSKKDDQDDPDVSRKSLHVLLRCLTDERFLEVLTDYESGDMEKRFQREFSEIGITTEGLKVKIENMEEVNKTKEIINKRLHAESSDMEEISKSVKEVKAEEEPMDTQIESLNTLEDSNVDVNVAMVEEDGNGKSTGGFLHGILK